MFGIYKEINRVKIQNTDFDICCLTHVRYTQLTIY